MDFISNHSTPVQSIGNAAHTTGTVTGATVDRAAGKRVAFLVDVGAWTNGTHTITFQDSPDGTNWTDIEVPRVRMPDDAPTGVVVDNTLVIDAATEDDRVYVVEYTGQQRYVRAVSVVGSGAAGAIYSVLAVIGDLRYRGSSQFA